MKYFIPAITYYRKRLRKYAIFIEELFIDRIYIGARSKYKKIFFKNREMGFENIPFYYNHKDFFNNSKYK